MKLKAQGKKWSKKVENEKKIAGEDKTGNKIFLQVHKEQEVRKEMAGPLTADRKLLTKNIINSLPSFSKKKLLLWTLPLFSLKKKKL